MRENNDILDVDLLIFDLDDTLVNWVERTVIARRRVAELLAARLSGSAAEWLEVLEERDGELWEKVVSGELLHEEVAELRMRRVLDRRNHSDDVVVAEACEMQHDTMLEEARVDEAAHGLLASLRERYSLYLLTNGVASMQWPTIKRLGLDVYFEEILICSELRSYKPHPQPFQEALQRANCPPHRACMIGNSWRDDIQPAVQLGMKTIWLNHEGIPSPNGSKVDHEIGSLQELYSFFKLSEG